MRYKEHWSSFTKQRVSRLINPSCSYRGVLLQLAWRLDARDSPAVSRPQSIGRNHPSHLQTVLHPGEPQHLSQQTLCNGICHLGLERGRILLGWSVAAIDKALC